MTVWVPEIGERVIRGMERVRKTVSHKTIM